MVKLQISVAWVLAVICSACENNERNDEAFCKCKYYSTGETRHLIPLEKSIINASFPDKDSIGVLGIHSEARDLLLFVTNDLSLSYYDIREEGKVIRVKGDKKARDMYNLILNSVDQLERNADYQITDESHPPIYTISLHTRKKDKHFCLCGIIGDSDSTIKKIQLGIKEQLLPPFIDSI
jgi:hypothetical protein